jgi:uncharacterized protein (TIGR00251 family)
MVSKISVKVHANSSQEKVKELGKGLEVWLKVKPVDGKANEKLIKLLKKHYKKNIKIIKGFSSRNKVIEIK